MNRYALRIILFFLLCLVSAPASAAVFQYSQKFEDSKKRERRALLWLPSGAAKIEGLVVCGTTLMERPFSKDPQIRGACRKSNLGILILEGGLRVAPLQQLLDQLSEQTGYEEIAAAPLIFVGHSAGGPQALELATAMADRCFGLIQYRGSQPSAERILPAGIPSVAMLGQFDEFAGTMRTEEGVESWEDDVDEVRSFRKLGADRLASINIEPGAGHFAWSERNGAYLAKWIAKAAKYRGRIDLENGWLTTLDLKGDIEVVSAKGYGGDIEDTSWHFDEEMALASKAYHVGLTDRRDQFIRWKDGHWVDAGARFYFFNLDWTGEGLRFRVSPDFKKDYPGQYKERGPIWLKAGETVGHGSNPIELSVIGGPLKFVGDGKFEISYDSLVPAGSKIRGTFFAYSKDDGEYRFTEQVGMLPRKFGPVEEGKVQEIEFGEISNVKLADFPVKLNVRSSAELPVQLYVDHGPAVIRDGALHLAELPERAKFPINVEVVAWQFGRPYDPKVQTAQPVIRRFQILGE